MKLNLTACIEGYGEHGFCGFIEQIPGLVVEGSSREEVERELFISLQVHISHVLGIDINNIEDRSAEELEVGDGKKHFNFVLAKA